MSISMGVDHIGVGATDADRAARFYGDLGFTEVAFDYTGALPGLERVAGRPDVRARVVMLRNPGATVLGLGAVKLVQVLDRPVPPLPDGIAWGERGICEVCVHVRDYPALYRRLVDERGYPALMEPDESVLTPHDTRCGLAYTADPDGGKVELIEWHDLEAGWPLATGPQGVHHVAFGVADIERTRDFYGALGFTGMLFESDGYFEPMHPWYRGEPPRQRMMCLTNPRGAGLEPVQHYPPSPDMRGEWGHAGAMEFAIGVRNLEVAAGQLRERGIELLCEPQTIDVGSGEWRYAYFVDPDELYVCLTESRY